jgi:MFS family permease
MFSKKTYEIGMVLSITGLYFFSFFQRVAVPGSIFNDLQTEFAISASDVTRLSAIYLFVYASMQPFAGYLADRFGGIRVVIVSGLLLCLGSILFPLSQGEWGLYLSRALVGLGGSTMYLCMVKETDHYFGGKNFAPIFGLLCLLGYAGGLAGTKPFRILVENIGWRDSCMTAAVITGAILACGWILMRKVNREETVKKTDHIFKSMGTVFKNRLNYPLLITIPICFSIYLSIQATIGSKFLEDSCGIPPLTSSGYTFTMMGFTLSVMLFSGFASKMIGNRRKCFVIFNAITTMLAMTMILTGIIFKLHPSFFLVAFILSATASGCTPVNASFMRELNPPNKVAVSIGIFNTVVYVMVAVMAQVIGQVLDIFKDSALITEKARIYPPSAYITIFGIFLALSIVAVVASFYCRETHGRNITS